MNNQSNAATKQEAAPLTNEQREFIVNNPELVLKAADNAVAAHLRRRKAIYAIIIGAAVGTALGSAVNWYRNR